MAKFWYYTIHKCPDCGATYDEYDHTAPWCDSGLSSSPVVKERCPDCWEEHVAKDKLAHPEDYEDA